MYKLYSFTPDLLIEKGYEFIDIFDSIQSCDNHAFNNEILFYRIEFCNDWGCSLVYETPVNLYFGE